MNDVKARTAAAPSSSPSPEQREISLIDVLIVLAENKRLLFFVPLFVAAVAVGVSFFVPPLYTASARLIPPQQQGMANSLMAQFGGLASITGVAGLKNPADQYVAFLRSRVVADRLIERFNLKEYYEQQYFDDSRRRLAERSSISAGKDGLITVEVDDNDPKRARDLADAYVEELQRLTSELAVTEAAQRRLFFQKQLDEAKGALIKAQAALRETGVSESTLKANPVSAVEIVARLRAQITAQELQLASLRSSVTESHPEYLRVRAQLDAVRVQLAQAERADAEPAGAGADYIDRYRNFKYAETLNELLVRQFEAARIDEMRQGALVQVVDHATLPEKKSKPKRAVIAMLSYGGALLAVLLFISVRQAVRSAEFDERQAGKLRRLKLLLGLKAG